MSSNKLTVLIDKLANFKQIKFSIRDDNTLLEIENISSQLL